MTINLSTRYYVNEAGKLIGAVSGAEVPSGFEEVPEPPSGNMRWNGAAWAEVVLDPAEKLNAFRATASMPRFNFAAKAATLGYITFEEAADWAAGNTLPVGVQGVINALAAELRGPALLDVKASPIIRRDAALMAPLAAAFGTDEAGLDVLFGWAG